MSQQDEAYFDAEDYEDTDLFDDDDPVCRCPDCGCAYLEGDSHDTECIYTGLPQEVEGE